MLKTLKAKSKRIASTLAAGVLLFSQIALVPSASAHSHHDNGDHQKVTVCHANNGNGSGGFSQITVDDDAVDGNGNGSSDHNRNDHQSGRDIIPPFDTDGDPGTWTARNWDAEGQAIWYSGCDTPDDGSVKIVKDVLNGIDPQDFTFTYNKLDDGQNATSFTLDDDGDESNNGGSKLPSSKTFSNDVNAATYEVIETNIPSGWSLTGIVCDTTRPQGAVNVVSSTFTNDLPNNKVTINLGTYKVWKSQGQGHWEYKTDNVVCTFQNSKLPTTGSLTVKKNVVNDNGNNKNYSNFHFSTNSGTPYTLDANGATSDPLDGIKTFANLTPGQYTVVETDANTMGYTTSYTVGATTNDTSCVVTVVAGQEAVCTITNDDQDPLLTLQKVVVKDNGGTAHASDWTLKAQAGNNAPAINTAPSVVSVDTTTNSTAATTATDVAPGSYTLSETGGPSGYAASDWTCDGGTLVGNTVTVTYGDHVTCTITNDDIAPLLTVNKNVFNNNGGTANPDDFKLTVGGLPVLSGVQQAFNADTYTVGETQQDGYSFLGFGGACDSLGVITLALGGVYTCNLFNDDQPATIKVTKVVVNDNGGHAKAKDWTLKVGDTIVKSGDVNTFSGNAEYTISESDGPKGYEQTDLTCYDTTAETTVANPFTAKLGHNYECTITNDDIAPKLTIVKDAQPNSYQPFTFDLQRKFGEYHQTFQLKDGFFLPWLTNNKTFTLPHSGLYTVTEQATDGWYLDDLTCWNTEGWSWTNTDVDASKATVKLGIGDEVTCKFVNNKYGHIDGVKFNDINKNGKYDWNFGGGTPEPLISDWTINLYQDEELVQTTTTNKYGIYGFDNLKPGTYTLCEAQQDGWVQTVPGDNERTPDGCYTIHIYPGTSKHDVKFGNFQYATVSGIKFNDVNGNGQRDEGEPTLANWTIKLTKTCPVVTVTQNQIFSVAPAPACQETTVETATDENGEYSFTDLDLGTYKVCEVQQDKWVQTYPSKDGCYDFTVTASSQTFTDKDFGNHPVPQVLSETTTLVNTGASTAIGTMAGLTILGLLGGLYFVTRRKNYQN